MIQDLKMEADVPMELVKLSQSNDIKNAHKSMPAKTRKKIGKYLEDKPEHFSVTREGGDEEGRNTKVLVALTPTGVKTPISKTPKVSNGPQMGANNNNQNNNNRRFFGKGKGKGKGRANNNNQNNNNRRFF